MTKTIDPQHAAELFELFDDLTAAIGKLLGVDFGEHSNANDPWHNALSALAEANAGKEAGR